MASLVYNAALADMIAGRLDLPGIYVLLATDDFEPNQAHASLADLSDEVIGAGYDEGGQAVKVTLKQTASGLDLVLGDAYWAEATIAAHYAVYYEDERLIAAIDFGEDVVSENGEFVLGESIIRIQN